ncbi:hypothetical protein FGRMN_10784 [Fusarium graminum]|nr:hypothetical protein FGRMN_10784 [Fusarium graminum]
MATAMAGNRLGASPYYLNSGACPERCSISGPEPGNWSVYSDLGQLRSCQETIFYAFSLYDPVDDDWTGHRIHACTSFGPDFAQLPSLTIAQSSSTSPISTSYEIGWWDEGFGMATSGIRSITRQARQFLTNGHGKTDGPTIMFARFGQATIGLYVGRSVDDRVIGSSALQIFEDNLTNLNITAPSLAMQLCGPDSGSAHSFGLMVTSNGTFGSLQNAVQSWANGTCLSFPRSTNMTGQAAYTTPLDNSTDVKNSTRTFKHVAKHAKRHGHLHARAECKTTKVEGGDSCAKLAQKCGISASDFTKYNPGSSFCANLVPKQYVCCSKGELPDLRPSKNSDGSCHAYKVEQNDNCASIAIENGLKMEDLESFNKRTWSWAGCKRLLYKTVMCLSEGTPPFPDAIANAQCGPQKPGTQKTGDTTDISDLNPCPLNACCNVWGQCGITKDFCVDTNTGAPGTAKENTNGCISNCGTKVVKSSGGGDSIRVGYFQGYGMSRDCLYQDASQIDTSKYTHLHFAFGTLTKDYDVEVGSKLSQYQFKEFASLENVNKVLSFGGWDFSANPATYSIFREGVKPANRLKMATKIARFITDNKLDGVDIDWEYPGAPDIPGIPPADKDDGKNYLAFLVVLKNLLKGKSVSIAAPSSYWYLKQYPIKDIGRVVDYIVYMTYDLHGQWDTDNSFSQEGCAHGNCLRSQVNLTETQYSLAMITKAGVPSNKVIVGITSYGRSYKMAKAGCNGPDCFYTGNKLESDAKKGKCTNTAGYIADAEIDDILKDTSRVVKHYVDTTSHSDVLVYDDTEWVSYMSPSIKAARQAMYSAFGMGGTTDWAVDLQAYNDVPKPAKSWAMFKEGVMTGYDPKRDHTRTGNWTAYYCTNTYIRDIKAWTPSERWKGLRVSDAWNDAIRIWRSLDRDRKYTFSKSISMTLQVPTEPDCQSIGTTDCNELVPCGQEMDGDLSGPAAQLLWNSLVNVHQMYTEFYNEIHNAAAIMSFSLDDFGDKFAPIPDPEDNTWLLVLIDLLTWGTAAVAGPFFNSFLKRQAYFLTNPNNYDNVKDTTMTIIGQSTTLAKDLLTKKDSKWTVSKQDSFKSYMGQVLDGWSNLASDAVYSIFSGNDTSINLLWELISDGKMIDGGVSDDSDGRDLKDHISKAFYGFTIPTLWRVSETYAFVLDSGSDCDAEYPMAQYLDKDTMDATGACYKGKRYYLVYPKDDSEKCHCVYTHTKCEKVCQKNKFSIPPGLDALDGSRFGKIKTEDLIAGSVRTYIKNGNKNTAAVMDPISDNVDTSDLIDVDITTPGVIRLPVCTPARAYQSWDTASKGSSPFYPCDFPPGRKECEESSFKDETSGKSPLVKDCLDIIKNTQGDGGTKWTTQVVGENQREIAFSGTCAFGVEATKVDGNVQFYFGGQDVANIINAAVKEYSNDGKVGATGDLHCNGNIKKQPVHWAIYHT